MCCESAQTKQTVPLYTLVILYALLLTIACRIFLHEMVESSKIMSEKQEKTFVCFQIDHALFLHSHLMHELLD